MRKSRKQPRCAECGAAETAYAVITLPGDPILCDICAWQYSPYNPEPRPYAPAQEEAK